MGKHRTFERVDGTGITEEWLDDMNYIVAYLDRYHSHPMVTVILFKPEVQGSRQYFNRKMHNARALVERHLATQTYTEDSDED